jgi:hypothetical protein
VEDGFANLITSFGPNCNCEEAWDTDAMRVPSKTFCQIVITLLLWRAMVFFPKKNLFFYFFKKIQFNFL